MTSGLSGFIGRQTELKKFEAALDDFTPDSPHIAFIYDAAAKLEDKGGIGKTKLLYEFMRIAKFPKYEKNFVVIDEVVDFYEPVNRDQVSRVSRIVSHLEEKTGTHAFDRFEKNVREYYLKRASIERVMEDYWTGYNQMCEETGKKVIRFFDTFEIAESNLNYLKESYRFIEDQILANSVIVISGRNQPNLSAPIWGGFADKIIHFPLQGFSDEDAAMYFKSAKVTDLQAQQIVALNHKAQGRPILLALVVDYLKNILNLEDILELNEKDFKEGLVEFIKKFKNPPIDQALLAMAHLKHWCNEKFLERFVKPNQDFAKNYEVLKSLSFVRSLGAKGEYVVLHDQMQEMVSQYILDKDYADGSLRREISEWAIDFYLGEIKAFKQREGEYLKNKEMAKWQVVRDERFALQAELWYHQLYVKRAENINDFFFELYDPSLERGYLDYCFIVHNHLDDLGKLLELSQHTKNRIKLRLARVNAEKYQFTNNQYYRQESLQLFDELLKEAQTKQLKKLLGVVLCDFGALKYYLRELTTAEKMLRDSIKVLQEEIGPQEHDSHYFLGKSKNWLGYVLYTQGKFSESIDVLEDAEKNLFTADNLVKADPEASARFSELRCEQLDAWIAQVRGNLCRINREIGDTKKSIYYGESSLARRRRLENPREIVKGLNSLGLVYSRYGDIGKALALYEEAEGFLQNVPDPILKGRILTNKATLLFKRDSFSDLLSRHTRATLVVAKNDLKLDKAELDMARKLLLNVIDSLYGGNSRELATAYHNLGELNLLEEKFDQAIASFNDALRVAEIETDAYTQLNSLQRLVLTAYLKYDSTLFHEFVSKFEQARESLLVLEETARYVMRFYITIGNFYYHPLLKQEIGDKFDEAFRRSFQAYTNAIGYTKNYAPGSMEFAQEVFAERIFELLKTKVISQNLRDELLQEWQKHGLDVNDLQRYLNF